jgi:glutamyl-tRNA synthetase
MNPGTTANPTANKRPTITRFAPSPTGDLHVGAVRTALYSWLYAHHKGGKFILRIEDTDQERSTEAAIKVILDGMAWLGIDYDGQPYRQTERFARYQEVLEQLLVTGHAYKCYCSKERVEQLRETQLANKEKPRYDGLCREKNYHLQSADPQQPFVIRFKNPLTGDVVFDDAVRGHIVVNNQELDDLVLQRSDGYPTYNFAVVVDDLDMRITEVIRGEDHIANTPRQINIFNALGATPPKYAHLPMILGADGKKLSKRHGAVSVLQYQQDGYLPEALLNYLVRLGWSHQDQEIFSKEEMIRMFSLDHISKSAAAFNNEKLLWLNQHYIKTLPVEYVAKHLAWNFEQRGIDYKSGPSLDALIVAFRDRAHTLVEIIDKAGYLYVETIDPTANITAIKAHLIPPVIAALEGLLVKLVALKDWQQAEIKAIFDAHLKETGLKMPQLAQPIRVAVTGDVHSPSIDVTLALLWKEKTVARLEAAIKRFGALVG